MEHPTRSRTSAPLSHCRRTIHCLLRMLPLTATNLHKEAWLSPRPRHRQAPIPAFPHLPLPPSSSHHRPIPAPASPPQPLPPSSSRRQLPLVRPTTSPRAHLSRFFLAHLLQE
ncbi:unnamed protein product [Linum tenue]|uniref:Uncharacterized protein n=1 Tax=Linum tenue TaxID=586396 RepID=A0AAV0M2G5_9ROSI|nr:unnamed protein product [Linum tenue]